jgi:hypothetical protein
MQFHYKFDRSPALNVRDIGEEVDHFHAPQSFATALFLFGEQAI